MPFPAIPVATPVVDRCCCADVRFRDLRRVADSTGTPLEVLVRQTGCGAGCGLCRPYLRVMLQTGQTEIPLLTPGQLAELADDPHMDRADSASADSASAAPLTP